LPKTAIIIVVTSPKSICMYVEETILEYYKEKPWTLQKFGIWLPNVAFFDELELPFTCQQENMKI